MSDNSQTCYGPLAMMPRMDLHYTKIESPLGELYLVADETHLHALIFKRAWTSFKKTRGPMTEGSSKLIRETARQLKEYFAGRRRDFDIPLASQGTEFQKEVWNALCKIPYGKTISYQEQAESIGRPKAMRAVGGTNGKNPISIIVPCHRVIGCSGKLTGYAGGLENKEFLLKLEGIKLPAGSSRGNRAPKNHDRP